MKFCTILLEITLMITWTVAAPSGDTSSYLIGIRQPSTEYLMRTSQSELYLMKIAQRISTALISPEQKQKADAIFELAKENFQKCENDYLMNSHVTTLYRTCLGTYMRLAMTQIRALELDNRHNMFVGVPMFGPNTITSSVSSAGMTTNQDYGLMKPNSNSNSNSNSANRDDNDDKVSDLVLNAWRMVKENEPDNREQHFGTSL